MENTNIILWAICGGFSIQFALMRLIWGKIDKLDEKLTDVDRRLCRVEGAMSAKNDKD